VAYVGALGRHLDVLGAHNSPSVLLPPGANIYDYIPDPDFSPNSNYETTNGKSSYNSLQVVYSRQLSRGLAVLANWTYSRCQQDQLGLGQGVSSYRAQWLPGFGPEGDYQVCDTDATDVIHLSGSYELPVGRGRQFLSSAGKAVDAQVIASDADPLLQAAAIKFIKVTTFNVSAASFGTANTVPFKVTVRFCIETCTTQDYPGTKGVTITSSPIPLAPK
jgi:hypothetical protein